AADRTAADRGRAQHADDARPELTLRRAGSGSPVGVRELRREAREAAPDEVAQRRLAALHPLCGLSVGEARKLDEADRLALVLGQLGERALEAFDVLTPACDRARRADRRVGHPHPSIRDVVVHHLLAPDVTALARVEDVLVDD